MADIKDISPGLLKGVRESFDAAVSGNKKISGLYMKLEAGVATYAEANNFAIEVGETLARAFQNNLSGDVLPNGKMYYNIAKAVVEPMMINNHDLIANFTEKAQKSLNEAANIGIKAIRPELNRDRIDGIINKLTVADEYDDVSWLLGEPIVNFSQSIVDDAIRINAEFHYNSGLQPVIIRKEMGNCCNWCKEVVGRYSYPDVPKDVYRRHQHCRCTVDYYPGDGKKQNVHTKKWQRLNEKEALQQRKELDSQSTKQYNNSPAKNLKRIYDEDVATGWISPLVGFEKYLMSYNRINNTIVGRRTSNGVLIRGQTRHFMQRVAGTMVDPKVLKEELKIVRRSGVEIEDVKEALFNGTARKPVLNPATGKTSILYIGKKCEVSLNPETGELIQCNPRKIR